MRGTRHGTKVPATRPMFAACAVGAISMVLAVRGAAQTGPPKGGGGAATPPVPSAAATASSASISVGPPSPPVRPLSPAVAAGTAAPSTTKAPTTKSTFLDVVALTDAHGLRCTGVLVAPRWVLTARHCVPVTSALFGASVQSATATRTIAASRVPTDRRLDVALVQLDSAAPVKARARRGESDSADPKGVLRIVGFGANEPSGKRGAGTQRQVDIQTTGWGCDSRRASTTGCMPAFEMVLGRRGTGDTCNGDSGGPAFESVDGGYRLVAITSRAVRNAAQACGDGGISTRVDRIASWIDTVIGRTP